MDDHPTPNPRPTGRRLTWLVVALSAVGLVYRAGLYRIADDPAADDPNVPWAIWPWEPWHAEGMATDDGFENALREAAAAAGTDDPTVTAKVAALTELREQQPDLLWRYLASSAAWRVYEDRGKRLARRRLKVGPSWQEPPQGYYTNGTIGPYEPGGAMTWQFRLELGWDGQLVSWQPGLALAHGQAARAVVGRDDYFGEGGLWRSDCGFAAGKSVLAVIEQSQTPGRRLTEATLRYLEQELRPLVDKPTLETLRANLPHGSVEPGEASLVVGQDASDYLVWSRVNPGEPGRVYVQRGSDSQPGSWDEEIGPPDTNEWVGWSDDPTELFLSCALVKGYRERWDPPFVEHFSLWFHPDSGGPDRKLLERAWHMNNPGG